MDKLPDHEIELFWSSFKQSMINFYNEEQMFTRPIKMWCDKLNSFQKRKEYDKIERNVSYYITLHAIDVMKCMNVSRFNILETNIKRWIKIRNKYSFFTEPIKYQNAVFLCMKIFRLCRKKIINKQYLTTIQNFFQEIELIIVYEDFISVVELAIKIDSGRMLDKLQEYTDIHKKIEKHYRFRVPKKISGKKLIVLLQQLKYPQLQHPVQ